MAIFICENCGKEFKAKPSANRKYCCKQCSDEAKRGKKMGPRVEKIKVICAECGKEEYVNPCRAKNYVCCSVECLAKYNSKRYSKKIKCVCPICNKEFELKPYSFNRVLTTPCCSKECANELKKSTYKGENNHQFGLKGSLNSSFKGYRISHKNNHIEDVWVYKPERPDSNRDGRITEHRLKILENYQNYDEAFFTNINGFATFKDNIIVHHIDGNHSNNSVENLIPVTKKEHTRIHNFMNSYAIDSIHAIIGVFKQGELPETPEVDNQQPSISRNINEGSETNSRDLASNVEVGNTDTSALLSSIKDTIDDYIVQTRNIAKVGYNNSIKEILESEIKNSE